MKRLRRARTGSGVKQDIGRGDQTEGKEKSWVTTPYDIKNRQELLARISVFFSFFITEVRLTSKMLRQPHYLPGQGHRRRLRYFKKTREASFLRFCFEATLTPRRKGVEWGRCSSAA